MLNMIYVEKWWKKSWYSDCKCKSMKEAKSKAKKLSETHDGEVKAEKRNRNDYLVETYYYENGKETSSYLMQ